MLMRSNGPRWPRRARTAIRPPLGITTAIGAAVVVAATVVAATIPVGLAGWRIGTIAAVLCLFSVATRDPIASAVVAASAYLIADGFLVNRLGDLSWQGPADLRRAGVLAAASAVGLALGWLLRMYRSDEEERRGA